MSKASQLLHVLGSLLFALIILLAGRVLYYYWIENYSHQSEDEPYKCIMSWMRPNYIPLPFNYIDDDDSNASTLSKYDKSPPYTLYRFVDDIDQQRKQKLDPKSKYYRGIPILFVHGNSGSMKQGRALGVSPLEFISRLEKYQLQDRVYLDMFQGSFLRENVEKAKLPQDFDVFLVDFNEQLSALSGDVLVRQAKYVRGVMKYITSLYTSEENKPKEIIAVGHSMGGIVLKAASALTVKDILPIRTLITLSTPFKRHPVLLDRDSDLFYQQLVRLPHPKVDIFSIGGGWHDELIRSDLTGNPLLGKNNSNFYHIMSTTSVPNTHCSTDHQAITWCKQIILPIAKFLVHYAYEGGMDLSTKKKVKIFEKYFTNKNSELSFYNNPPKKYDISKYNLAKAVSVSSPLTSSNPVIHVKNILKKVDEFSLLFTGLKSEVKLVFVKTNSTQVLIHDHIDSLPFFDVVGSDNDIDESRISPKKVKSFVTLKKKHVSDYDYIIVDSQRASQLVVHDVKVTVSTHIGFHPYPFLLSRISNHLKVNFAGVRPQFAYSLRVQHFCKNNLVDGIVKIKSHDGKEERIEPFSSNLANYKLKFFESNRNHSKFQIEFISGCELSNGDVSNAEATLNIDIFTTLIMFFRYHYSTTIASNAFSLILFAISFMAWNNFTVSFHKALNVSLFTRGFVIVLIELVNIHLDLPQADTMTYHESEPIYIVLSLITAFSILHILYFLLRVVMMILYLPARLLKFVFTSSIFIIACSLLIAYGVHKYMHIGLGFLFTLVLMLLNMAVSSEDAQHESLKSAFLMLHSISTIILLPSCIVWIKEWKEMIHISKTALKGIELFTQTIPPARFANMINPVSLLPCLVTFVLIFINQTTLTKEFNFRHYLIMVACELAAAYSTMHFRFTLYGYALICSAVCSILIMLLTLLKKVDKEKTD